MARPELSQSNSSNWWAYVMYANDHVKEFVPLHDVFTCDGPTQPKQPFRPKDLEDFDPRQKYVIKTSTGNSKGDGKKHPYWGFISKLGVSKKDCMAKASQKRSSFPECREILDEPESSSNEHIIKIPTTGVHAVLTCRDENKKKEAAKRLQEKTDLERIVAASINKTTETHEDDVVAMKREIKRLEAALAKEKQSKAATKFDPKDLVELIKNDLDQKIKDFGESLQRNLVKSVADEVAKAVDQRMSDILREAKLSSSAGSTSGVSSLSSTQLGGVLHCSWPLREPYFSSLKNVPEGDIVNWAKIVLRGAFSHPEKMRLKGKGSTESFPPAFLEDAKEAYRKWLGLAEGGKMYSVAQIDRMVGELPSYLSARATDMVGPRGLDRTLRKTMAEEGITEAQAAERLPPSLKKKYEERQAAQRLRQQMAGANYVGDCSASEGTTAAASEEPAAKRAYCRLGSKADLARPTLRERRARRALLKVVAGPSGLAGGQQEPNDNAQPEGRGRVQDGLLQLEPVRRFGPPLQMPGSYDPLLDPAPPAATPVQNFGDENRPPSSAGSSTPPREMSPDTAAGYHEFLFST